MNDFYKERLSALKTKTIGKLIDFTNNQTKVNVEFFLGGKQKKYTVTINFDINLPKNYSILYKILNISHVVDTYYNAVLEKTDIIKENKKEFYLKGSKKCCKEFKDERAINSGFYTEIIEYNGNDFDFTDLLLEREESIKYYILFNKWQDLDLKNDLVSKCGKYNLNFKLCYWQEYCDTEIIYNKIRISITKLNSEKIIAKKNIKKDILINYLNKEGRCSVERFAICEYFFKKYFSDIKDIDFDFGSSYFLFAEENNIKPNKKYDSLLEEIANIKTTKTQ